MGSVGGMTGEAVIMRSELKGARTDLPNSLYQTPDQVKLSDSGCEQRCCGKPQVGRSQAEMW
jgi:hypothetical protein